MNALGTPVPKHASRHACTQQIGIVARVGSVYDQLKSRGLRETYSDSLDA